MAEPVDFPESNFTFVGPAGSDILDLKAYLDQSGIISCWEISDAELEILNSTKRIWVRFFGHVQPPMMLLAEMPFDAPVDFPEDIDTD